MSARLLLAAGFGTALLIACSDDPTTPDRRAFSETGVAPSAPLRLRVPQIRGEKYTIKVRDDTPVTETLAEQLATAHSGTVTYVFKHVINGFNVILPNDQAADALRANPLTEHVVQNRKMIPHQFSYARQSQIGRAHV